MIDEVVGFCYKPFSRIFTIESGRLGEMANQNTNEGATQGSIES